MSFQAGDTILLAYMRLDIVPFVSNLYFCLVLIYIFHTWLFFNILWQVFSLFILYHLVSEPCEPADSPCCMATILDDDARHVSQRAESEEDYIDNSAITGGWYGFKYQNQWAQIPTECIKVRGQNLPMNTTKF